MAAATFIIIYTGVKKEKKKVKTKKKEKSRICLEIHSSSI